MSGTAGTAHLNTIVMCLKDSNKGDRSETTTDLYAEEESCNKTKGTQKKCS